MARETLYSIAFGGLPDRPEHGTPEVVQAADIRVGDLVEHGKGRWPAPRRVTYVGHWLSFDPRRNPDAIIHIEGQDGRIVCPPTEKFARYTDKKEV